MVRACRRGKTEWLEFKAAMVGRLGDRKNSKENDADGYWNVAKAVIAMNNGLTSNRELQQ